MVEDTHREKAQTVGTLTITMTKVFFRASKNVWSPHSRIKLPKPIKLPALCILASVRLRKMQVIMGMTTKPMKKNRLGSINR